MGRSLWKNFIRSWKQQTTMQLATLSVLTGTFVVITVFFSLQKNLSQILSQWGEAVQITVYLNDLPESKVEAMTKDLKNFDEVATIEFVPKEIAAERFQKQMGSYAPNLLNDSEFGNPLPSSFEIKLESQANAATQYDLLVELAKKISSWDGVDEVAYGQGWVENYASLVKSFTVSTWVLLVILLSGSLFVIGNSIRNSISQRREEIEIMELVGATPSMIRVPYIVEGALMGAMASLLAMVFCYGLYLWQAKIFADNLGFWGLGAQMSYLSFWEMIQIVLMGTVFGALGSFICVRKLCTGWAAAQREEAWN